MQQVSPGTSVGLSIVNLSEISFSANDTPASVSHTHPIEIYHYRKQSKPWEPSPTHQANLNVISNHKGPKYNLVDRRSSEWQWCGYGWMKPCRSMWTKHSKAPQNYLCYLAPLHLAGCSWESKFSWIAKDLEAFARLGALGQNCWQGMQQNSPKYTVPTWASSCYYFVLISLCMDYANLPAWSIVVYSVANNWSAKKVWVWLMKLWATRVWLC